MKWISGAKEIERSAYFHVILDFSICVKDILMTSIFGSLHLMAAKELYRKIFSERAISKDICRKTIVGRTAFDLTLGGSGCVYVL